MLIKTNGYPIKFIQTHPVKDESDHLKSFVFKFFSTKNKLHYIIRAEYHKNDFFAIKFYAKKDRKSENKYSKVTNKGDVASILVSSAKAIPYLLKEFPNASFGFIGSRTIDTKTQKVENYINNQRYRLYKYHLPQLIGNETFKHIAFKNSSAYALLNNNQEDLIIYEQKLKKMLINTYNDIVSGNLTQ
jgi:hypothetical protein